MLPRVLVIVIGLTLALPMAAHAHGGDESGIAGLKRQPARTLAQQAHALLHIRHDRKQAAVRLDAAVASRDTKDVDMASLRRAMDLLDKGGSEEQVMGLIDEALSRPLGARSGRLFHGAGRELSGVHRSQEVWGLVLGLLLTGAGGVLLVMRRGRTAS